MLILQSCRSLNDCEKELKVKSSMIPTTGDSKYISEYLEREYYVL